jgi:hypothetical protein
LSWKDRGLKNDRQQPNSIGMTGRLIRLLFAIVIGTALIGAPAVQAMIATPCDTVVTATPDHMLSSGQAPASVPVPCKGTMPGCADMVGCGVSTGLPARVTVLSHKLTWTPAIYRAIADAHEGLTVKPDLGPPITI